VQVAGRTKGGGWLLVKGGPAGEGFVAPAGLVPVIDGRLEEELTGEAQIGAIACRFAIRFDAATTIEGQNFHTFDYEVTVDCTRGGRHVQLVLPMFITEVPYRLSAEAVYQISLDNPDIPAGEDEVLSSIVLYDRTAGKVTFDAVSLPRFGNRPAVGEAAAADVPAALKVAVPMALSAWNDKAWQLVFGR
jgi:hypothetical protein